MNKLDCRLNLYLSEDVKENLKKYAEDNGLTLSSSVNFILKQYFNSQDAIKSIGNLSELMRIFAKQTGINLTAEQPSST